MKNMRLKLFYEIEAKVYEIKAQVSHGYELIWCFTLYRNGYDTSILFEGIDLKRSMYSPKKWLGNRIAPAIGPNKSRNSHGLQRSHTYTRQSLNWR